MSGRKTTITLCVMCFALASWNQKLAAQTTPHQVIEQANLNVLEILNNQEKSVLEKKQSVRKVIAETFDLDELGIRSLGHIYRNLDEHDRKDFLETFREWFLLTNFYVSKISHYSGEKAIVGKEAVTGKYAQVEASTEYQGKEVLFVFRLRLKKEAWLIYDVTVSGISCVAAYRSQFSNLQRIDRIMHLMEENIQLAKNQESQE